MPVNALDKFPRKKRNPNDFFSLSVKWRNSSNWESIRDQINSALLLALQTCTVQGLVPSHLQLVLLQLCLLLLLPQPQGQLAEGEAVIVQRRPHARHRRRSNLATKGQQLQSGKSELKFWHLVFSSVCLSRCCERIGHHASVGRQHQAEAPGFQISQRGHSAHKLRRHLWYNSYHTIRLEPVSFHFVCCSWAICRHFFSFQMRFSRLFAMRAWALCGTAPSRPSCWCWTLPSSSWFMKDWRGSWRKAFPGRWVRGEIKWGLGILEDVKTKKDEEETSVQRVIIQQPWSRIEKCGILVDISTKDGTLSPHNSIYLYISWTGQRL